MGDSSGKRICIWKKPGNVSFQENVKKYLRENSIRARDIL
jgi:hypothetical protein